MKQSHIEYNLPGFSPVTEDCAYPSGQSFTSRLSITYTMTMQDSISTHLVRLALAAGVSAFILSTLIVLVSSGHAPAERPHILELLSNTVGKGVGLFLILHLVGLVIRALRYRHLIQAAGELKVPGFWHMLLVTGFRNMVVDMLPSRLGELGYVALLNRVYKVSAATCLSSLAIAMIFDFVALALIVLGIILVYLVGSGVQGWLWSAMLVAVAVSAIGALGLTAVLPWTVKWLRSIHLKGTLGRILSSVTELLASLDTAIKTTRSSGSLVKVLLLSLLIRGCKYGSIFLLFMAVAEPSLPAIAEAAKETVLAAIVGAEIGASLPLPTFMSFGTYEAGGTLVFSLLGISEQEGLLALLGVHIWTQIFDYSIGGCCLVLVILLGRRGNT
ncbi:MAG: lysylphosphatidylglycerol synthase transmembrane domain-containing protein, partial [bacterium]